MSSSILDGYLAATPSGPNLLLPDQILRGLHNAGYEIDHTNAGMLIEQYMTLNDELNERLYVPRATSVQGCCRGYLAGFADDMIAWASLLTAQPELLKLILFGAENRPFDGDEEALATVARRIHEFWAEWRRLGTDSSCVLAQWAALSRPQSAPSKLLQ